MVNGALAPWLARKHFKKRTLLAQDEAVLLREREVRAPFRIGFQPRSVRLVAREAVERDEPPGHVVGSFVRQEVAKEVAPAARNNRSPVFRVRLERIALERIDLVADEASEGCHGEATIRLARR